MIPGIANIAHGFIKSTKQGTIGDCCSICGGFEDDPRHSAEYVAPKEPKQKKQRPLKTAVEIHVPEAEQQRMPQAGLTGLTGLIESRPRLPMIEYAPGRIAIVDQALELAQAMQENSPTRAMLLEAAAAEFISSVWPEMINPVPQGE